MQSMCCVGSLGRCVPSKKDTAGDHHRVTDPTVAESSENNRAREKRPPNGQSKRKSKSRRVKFEEAFPTQEVHRGDTEESKPHICVPPSSAVLDCGAAKSLSGTEPAAMLVQACEKRGRQARDDRKVGAAEEKYHIRGIGEQVITSFIKWHVPGALGRQKCIVRQASLMAARHHWLEMTCCLRGVHQSICILVVAGWRSRLKEPRQS